MKVLLVTGVPIKRVYQYGVEHCRRKSGKAGYSDRGILDRKSASDGLHRMWILRQKRKMTIYRQGE